MAKYQKYAEYQDSGVEWLGKVPSHWLVSGFKKYLESIVDYRGKTPEKVDEGVFLVTARNIKNGIVDYSLSQEFVAKNDYEQIMSRGKPLLKDVLFTTEAPLGEVAQIDDTRIALAQRIIKFRGKEDVLDNTFLKYFIMSQQFQDSLMTFATGSTALGIKAERLGYLQQCIPTFKEQSQITNFLDHETAKIDSLIEKQQQLIQLLKEKRQAVISHAVTKGLDPRVKMKDSGVEWLGEVPEHWGLVPLKYLCSFSGGGTPSKDNLSYWTDGDIPWVSPKDMKTFWIKETQDYITEKAIKESSTNMVEPNSLLMVVRSGILQRTIPIAINKVPVTMNQDMKALKFGNRVLVEYIADLIHGNTSELLLEWSKEGATVESIEHEYLANSIVPVPPIEEQQAITTLVAKKMDVYRELTCKAESQILLLQERRTALISAAVTGKIDVRNWQNPTEAKMEFSA